MSLMASFALSFFPRDVLDELWKLIESVSGGGGGGGSYLLLQELLFLVLVATADTYPATDSTRR